MAPTSCGFSRRSIRGWRRTSSGRGRPRCARWRSWAAVARDLVQVIQSYLEDPELIRHAAWLHRVERLAGRLNHETRRLEDTIYEARYYRRGRPGERTKGGAPPAPPVPAPGGGSDPN